MEGVRRMRPLEEMVTFAIPLWCREKGLSMYLYSQNAPFPPSKQATLGVPEEMRALFIRRVSNLADRVANAVVVQK
jgi:hypothetical protein